jgi:hypothetical protein
MDVVLWTRHLSCAVKRDIIGERLTMNVTKAINHYDNVNVTANVYGNYDKRGLPDPLVLAFYFTARRLCQMPDTPLTSCSRKDATEDA